MALGQDPPVRPGFFPKHLAPRCPREHGSVHVTCVWDTESGANGAHGAASAACTAGWAGWEPGPRASRPAQGERICRRRPGPLSVPTLGRRPGMCKEKTGESTIQNKGGAFIRKGANAGVKRIRTRGWRGVRGRSGAHRRVPGRERWGAGGGLGRQEDLAFELALPAARSLCGPPWILGGLDALFVKWNYEGLPPKVILEIQ